MPTILALPFLVDVNRRLHEHIRYVIRREPGVQACDATLTLKVNM